MMYFNQVASNPLGKYNPRLIYNLQASSHHFYSLEQGLTAALIVPWKLFFSQELPSSFSSCTKAANMHNAKCINILDK